MDKAVYTIGYSGFPMEDFLKLLRSRGVNVVIDVRSVPFSARFPDFNRDSIRRRLQEAGVHYRNYAVEFGARQEDASYYTADGYLDFEKFAKSPMFRSGCRKLAAGMAQGFRFALMCAEKDPIDCHRGIMIARALQEDGADVAHLLPDGKEEGQRSLEHRLLDMYFRERGQISLFDKTVSEEDLLRQAYRMRNKEIAYRSK